MSQQTNKATPTRRATGRRVTARHTGGATGQGSRAAQPGAADVEAGKVVRKGKNWTAKRGPARGPDAYPVQVCSTRYKDPVTGKWSPRPKDAPRAGQVRKGRAADPGMIVMRSVTDHGDGQREVTGARVILGGARAGQRRGKVKAAEVREAERELSRDALRTFNPRLADEVDRERMHEAHRSDKSRRGAATRAKNKAEGRGKKARPVDTVRRELLRTEEQVRDAERRHQGAKTYKTRQQHAETLQKRKQRLAKLRRELAQVGG